MGNYLANLCHNNVMKCILKNSEIEDHVIMWKDAHKVHTPGYKKGLGCTTSLDDNKKVRDKERRRQEGEIAKY